MLPRTIRARHLRIRKTPGLAVAEAAEAYGPTLRDRPDPEPQGEPRPLPFDPSGDLIPL